MALSIDPTARYVAAPSPTLPTDEGCYVNDGSGWIAVPCLCELWIENAEPGACAASVALSVSPPDQAAALGGALDVGVAFEDTDASWYAIWAAQAGGGDAFAVTSEGGTTTVELLAGDVALAPVPLAACETRKAMAYVSGSDTATLGMHAVIGGTASTDGSCDAIPPM